MHSSHAQLSLDLIFLMGEGRRSLGSLSHFLHRLRSNMLLTPHCSHSHSVCLGFFFLFWVFGFGFGFGFGFFFSSSTLVRRKLKLAGTSTLRNEKTLAIVVVDFFLKQKNSK